MQKGTVKVLHVFGRMQRGGAELRTLEAIKHLNLDNYTFDFLSLSGLEGELDDTCRDLGGNVFHIPIKTKNFKTEFLRLLKKEKYQIVHSHVHYSSGYILKLAYLASIPKRIAHFRNTFDGNKLTLNRFLKKCILKHWINKYATNIVAVSYGTIENVLGKKWKNDNRCQVIYNGIPSFDYTNVDKREVLKKLGVNLNNNSTTIYLHVGRMIKQKNHVRVVQIFKDIYKKNPNSILLLIGRKDEKIEKQILEEIRDIKDNVYILGERSDVRDIMKISDVLLFPSLWEGLPGVVLEACSVNLPVLASDISGVREIASHFNSVQYLSLDLDNLKWAETAIKLSKKNDKFYNNFNNSVFSMDEYVEKMKSLWEV